MKNVIRKKVSRKSGMQERYHCPECMRVVRVGFVGAKVELPDKCPYCQAEFSGNITDADDGDA